MIDSSILKELNRSKVVWHKMSPLYDLMNDDCWDKEQTSVRGIRLSLMLLETCSPIREIHAYYDKGSGCCPTGPSFPALSSEGLKMFSFFNGIRAQSLTSSVPIIPGCAFVFPIARFSARCRVPEASEFRATKMVLPVSCSTRRVFHFFVFFRFVIPTKIAALFVNLTLFRKLG